MIRRRAAAVLAVAALLAGGCASDPSAGYATASTFREDVRTVAVPIFESDAFTRDVQFHLTDALIREIQARTPYQVVSAGRADTVLLGRIRRVEHGELSKSRLTGLGQEVVVGVTIDFEWRDLRADRPIVERRGFAGSALFVPSRPSGEPIEIGEFAVVQQLARDIVAEMRSDW